MGGFRIHAHCLGSHCVDLAVALLADGIVVWMLGIAVSKVFIGSEERVYEVGVSTYQA